MISQNFVRMNMTSAIAWSLIWSVYPNLDCFGNGLMYAYEPWSGHYDINPTIWTAAHTTQFTEPGWQYLAVGHGSGELPDGGTFVTLRDPKSDDWTLVLETLQGQCMYHSGCFGKKPSGTQTVQFRVSGGLRSYGKVSVWRTYEKGMFEKQVDIVLDASGAFSLSIDADSIVTVSTTTGQKKASLQPPLSKPFPMPYKDDFEASTVGGLAKFFSDQGGSFAVASSPEGNVLKQFVMEPPGWNQWCPNPAPFSIIGDYTWTDVRVQARATIGKKGSTDDQFVGICARVAAYPGFNGPPTPGYCLRVFLDGTWGLYETYPNVLANGTLGQKKTAFSIALEVAGTTVQASIDGVIVASARSATFPSGAVTVNSGWHEATFDDFVVDPSTLVPPAPTNNALVKAISWYWTDWSARTCTPQPFSAAFRNNWSGWTGFAFTLKYDIKVSALGRLRVQANSATHELALFESGLKLASASVDMAKEVIDGLGFAYVGLAEPITLKAGVKYYLVSMEKMGGDQFIDVSGLSLAVDPVAGDVHEAYMSPLDGVWHEGKLMSYGGTSLVFN